MTSSLSIRSFQSLGSTYLPDCFTGSIFLSPIVTISSFNLILSLTKGSSAASENFTSRLLKFFSFFRYAIAKSILSARPEMVPFRPSLPTSIVPCICKLFSLALISI